MRQPPQVILDTLARRDDGDARTERRNALNSMRERLDAWIRTLDARQVGPSRAEVDAIVSDLEKDLQQLRRHGALFGSVLE